MEEDIDDMDIDSFFKNYNITYEDVENKPHDMILHLRDIEGIEITSFIFIIIFLMI